MFSAIVSPVTLWRSLAGIVTSRKFAQWRVSTSGEFRSSFQPGSIDASLTHASVAAVSFGSMLAL